MSCPFCDERVIEYKLLYETENEHVFYNIRPVAAGRCVVASKRHASNIRELSDKEAGSLLKTVRFVSEVLNQNLAPEGFNYGFNEGEYSGQSVDHLHFHVLPRYVDNDLPEFHLFHRDPKTKTNLSPEELTSSVERFRKIFKN